MEFVIILLIVVFVVLYRQSNGTSVYKFVVNNVETIYEKYAPYSFKVVREKCKEMGLEYSQKKYRISPKMEHVAKTGRSLRRGNALFRLITNLIVSRTIAPKQYFRNRRLIGSRIVRPNFAGT